MFSDRLENLENSRRIIQGPLPRIVRLKGFAEGKNAWGGSLFILGVFLFFFILVLYSLLPLAAA